MRNAEHVFTIFQPFFLMRFNEWNKVGGKKTRLQGHEMGIEWELGRSWTEKPVGWRWVVFFV